MILSSGGGNASCNLSCGATHTFSPLSNLLTAAAAAAATCSIFAQCDAYDANQPVRRCHFECPSQNSNPRLNLNTLFAPVASPASHKLTRLRDTTTKLDYQLQVRARVSKI